MLAQKREYLESMDIPVKPVTDQLIYSYDYGDNWKVLITCEDTYHSEENGVWKNGKGETVSALDGFLEDSTPKFKSISLVSIFNASFLRKPHPYSIRNKIQNRTALSGL